ncbi:MAG: hypothetical protein JWM57_3001 [Phycisphaerales bacterium]|nr:hypothetical protein [Phycisphaerales bacterium]
MRNRLFVTAVCLALSGCVQTLQHYVIEDTRSGHKYLAKGILDDISGPGIRFNDGLSGNTVRVEAFKLTIISPAAYDDAEKSGRAP